MQSRRLAARRQSKRGFVTLGSHELVTEFCRPLPHILHLLFLVLLLIFIHTQRVIFHFLLEHFVHHSRNNICTALRSVQCGCGMCRSHCRLSGDPTVIVIADTSSPKGQSAFFTEFAASRNACPARFFVLSVRLLNTLPPVMSHLHSPASNRRGGVRAVQVCLGASPSQALKCFSVGNFSPTLLPTSTVTVCASKPPIPSTRLRSTPLTPHLAVGAGVRYNCSRISFASFGAFLLCEFRFLSGI
jgi:hypothetical protein